MDDLRVITSSLSSNPYVTRFRADLPAAMLDRDLELGASDLGTRAALYQYARQTNIPPRPMCLGPGDGGFISNDVTVVVPAADGGVASLDGGVATTSGRRRRTPAATRSPPPPEGGPDDTGARSTGWGRSRTAEGGRRRR